MGAIITFEHKGDFSNTKKFLNKLLSFTGMSILDKYGKEGVAALRAVTPKDTGKTAESWDYKIEIKNNKASIIFTNSNIQNGANIAILIYYGHATKNGGYVEGRDYINPAVEPIFEQLANDLWKEVRS